MKGITVHQPWAWAMFAPIPDGPKDVENRSQLWHHRGDLAILAGRRRPDALRSFRCHQLAGIELPPDYAQPLGFVLGVVDLVDVHWAEPGCCSSRWAEHGPIYNAETGVRNGCRSHLVIARPRCLVEPVPATGFQGMRDLPASLGELVAGLVA